MIHPYIHHFAVVKAGDSPVNTILTIGGIPSQTAAQKHLEGLGNKVVSMHLSIEEANTAAAKANSESTPGTASENVSIADDALTAPAIV